MSLTPLDFSSIVREYENIDKQEEDSSQGLLLSNPLAYLQNYKKFWATSVATTPFPALEKPVKELVSKCTAKNADAVIQTFINTNWKHLKLPDCCNNLENQQFLGRKIAGVLLNPIELSEEIKQKIILNIFSNVKEYLSKAIQCIETDLQEVSFRKTFDIPIGSKLDHIHILGMETHNKGKNPLYVKLTHKDKETKIAFKPRSMLTEKLVSSTDKDSLFTQLNLPTYEIYHKDNNYGYCKWLENNLEENIFSSKKEVADYLQRLCIIDTLFSWLEIADQHYENVVVDNKNPYFIDVEARSPGIPLEERNTGLLDVDKAGGAFFNAYTKNRIWVEKDLAPNACEDLESPDFRTTAYSKALFEELNLLDEIINPAIENRALNRKSLSQKELNAIASVNEQLKLYPYRIILTDTYVLSMCIKYGIEDGFEKFANLMIFALKNWGYEITFDYEKLKEQFINDLMNDDVPIFYYVPPTSDNDNVPGKIYYGDFCLADTLSYS